MQNKLKHKKDFLNFSRITKYRRKKLVFKRRKAYESYILRDTFKNMPDFREEGKVKHKLIDILFIGVVAFISNVESWPNVEAFGNAHEEWLKKYIKLEYGIPSHDTFQRVFENIDTDTFNLLFTKWMKEIATHSKNRIVAIDGKTLCGSHDGEKKAEHIVNAWVDENNLILGQLKTASKSNEITAIPELLELLYLKDAIITIDAMGTQKKIAEKIIEGEGNYVLALKGNHKFFSKNVRAFFEKHDKLDYEDIKVAYKITEETGHGRHEIREYTQTSDIESIEGIDTWKGLSSVGKVKRTITKNGKTTVETLYYISSLETPIEGDCNLFAKAVRNHWGVESCHWILDVVFHEDNSRIRLNNGAANVSLLRKIALNIVKQEKVSTKKMSLKLKRYLAQ